MEEAASIASTCLTLCKRGAGADALQDEISSFYGGTSSFGRALACIMPKARSIMRPEKSLFNALLTHFLMGVALGLSLVLLLALVDAFHVRDLVAKSAAPVQTAVMLITTYGLMFGIGSALTGLVLTLEEES